MHPQDLAATRERLAAAVNESRRLREVAAAFITDARTVVLDTHDSLAELKHLKARLAKMLDKSVIDP